MLEMNRLTTTQLSESVGMSSITTSFSEGHPVEMYLNPFTVIWEEREENMCPRWNLNHSPGCCFPPSSHFQGPVKWNHTSGTKLLHISRGKCVLCCGACVLCYRVLHILSGWARVDCINPTLHLASAAFYSSSPSDFHPLALSTEWVSECTHQGTVTRGHTCREQWLDLSKADSTLKLSKGKKLWPVCKWSCGYIPNRGAHQLTWVQPDRLRWMSLWQPFPVVRYRKPLSVNL